MERTISGMMGKGSINHNTRAFSAKNVNKERSKYNIEFCHTNIKKVYHELFDEALERYNAKQKRSDRKIDNYYEKIRQGKQEKLFHEVIFQIGNKDDMNVKSADGQIAEEILIEFMQEFQGRNPNLYVFSAHLHMDEETPHLHIDFVPFIRNSKRGLDTRVSLKGALAKQGFKGGTRSATDWNQWIESEKQELSKVAERHGVHWKQLGTHNKHLSIFDFEKQERIKEVAELKQIISGSKEELSNVLHQQIAVEREMRQIRKKGEAIQQEVSELSTTNLLLKEQTEILTGDKENLLSENEKLEKQQKKLQREIANMADTKMTLERNIYAYDKDAKWRLPEPGVLMSAKTYREKYAMPLVETLKDTVKILTIKYVNFMELNERVKKQANDIDFYKNKIQQQYSRIELLQEKADDLERVKQYVGADNVDIIVRNTRELEQISQNGKQYNREYEISR